MSDKIEKFILENKRELDILEPRAELWSAIEKNLITQRKNKRWRLISIAASVVVLMAASFVAVQMNLLNKTKQFETNIFPQEQREAEFYYSSLIEVKRSELDKYRKEHPELCQEFTKQIHALDLLYSELKKEYLETPNKELVLSAMIENLQLQLQILSQQLEVINNVKQKKSMNYEKTVI